MFNPESKKDFLKAHSFLLKNLNSDAGKIRKINVGVGSNGTLKYVAPNFKEVPTIEELILENVKMHGKFKIEVEKK